MTRGRPAGGYIARIRTIGVRSRKAPPMRSRSLSAVAVLALGAAGLALPVTSASARPMAGEASVSAECVTRTDATSGRHAGARFDPHELSDAKAAAMDAALKREMKAKGVKVTADGKVTQGRKPGGGGGGGGTTPTPFTGAVIDVYWNVITDGNTGKLSGVMLDNQISPSRQHLATGYGDHRPFMSARRSRPLRGEMRPKPIGREQGIAVAAVVLLEQC